MKPDDQIDTNDEDIARLLQATGAREQLPDSLRTAWEGQFRDALGAARRERHRRYWRKGSGAAAVLLVAILGWFMRPSGPEPLAIEIVVRHVEGSVRLSGTGDSAAPVPGSKLALGDTLVTGAGYVALSYAGFDVRLNRDTELRMARDSVELATGEIYIGGSSVQDKGGLLVRTARGDIREVGTQFTVRLSKDSLLATVREGSIELSTAGASYHVEAATAAARQIAVTPEGRINLADAAARGAEWAWIHRAGETFELEGASALAFLEWVATETGRELVFMADAARIYASTTLLSGEIVGLDPEQALESVLATTDLFVAQPNSNQLEIRLQRPDP